MKRKSPKLVVGKKTFDNSNPFFIAEIGNNHLGKFDLCIKMIDEAKMAGANAVKLQKRNNKKLFTKKKFNEIYNSENSFGKTYGIHREKLEFDKKEYIELKKYSESLGLIFFATPFDIDSADFLHHEIKIPLFKLASSDLNNFLLIKKILSYKKPMILSTGFSSMKDVTRTYKYIEKKTINFSLLQCTASYPCKTKDLNLNVITTFKKKFSKILVGLSSHHNGIAMENIAYLLGARVFEKHFTTDRSMKGTDQSFSLVGTGLKKMIRDIKRIDIAMGSKTKKPLECERIPMKKMSKSIVFARNIRKGEKLSLTDVCIRCSGIDGISPWEIESLRGRKVKKDCMLEDVVTWEVLE